MGKIYCLFGKSSSGKDTLFKMLLEKKELDLKTIIPYTTRPIRMGERDGVEYHFSTEAEVEELEKQGKIIELRSYQTVHGVWKYFTVNDNQIDLSSCNYLIIGTLESYIKMRDYFGAEHLIPIYVEVEDGIRLERALARERAQDTPKYAEMCRRFLADSEDFSEEKLKAAGIKIRFENTNLLITCETIVSYIKEDMRGESHGY
ncbi:MAG: guanylate kinase [Lachnospiraceae bacterium]|nr:guanylate kinase [Lachnospiraceae bacterium]